MTVELFCMELELPMLSFASVLIEILCIMGILWVYGLMLGWVTDFLVRYRVEEWNSCLQLWICSSSFIFEL